MKYGQLIEYNKRNIFLFFNRAENEAKKLVLDLFLFFKKPQGTGEWFAP